MKKLLLSASAIIILGATAYAAPIESFFSETLHDSSKFVIFQKLPNSMPDDIDPKMLVVTVYKHGTTGLSASGAGYKHWDGARLNIPGAVACYKIQHGMAILCFDNDPESEKNAEFYGVTISYPANSEWFVIAWFLSLEEVQRIVGTALRISGNHDYWMDDGFSEGVGRPVPEPATAALALAGLALLFNRRRKNAPTRF